MIKNVVVTKSDSLKNSSNCALCLTLTILLKLLLTSNLLIKSKIVYR